MIDASGMFSKYVGDESIAHVWSDDNLIARMLQFETALAKASALCGIIPQSSASEIESVLTNIKISVDELKEGTYQNGVPIISLLGQVRKKLSPAAASHLHFGATSQDVLDTAIVLLIKESVAIFEERLATLEKKFVTLENKYGNEICLAHSRGQVALPISFQTKIKSWAEPLKRHRERLEQLKPRLFKVQLGGAVGDRASYADKNELLTKELAQLLQLKESNSWHSQRDTFVEFTHWLASLSGTLGKFGADILVMAQTEIGEVLEKQSTSGSSAMPHKNNPVLSEALVALARVNAGLQSTMIQSIVHENERDGTSWIMEWKTIPAMAVNTGAGLLHALVISSEMQVNVGKMRENVQQFQKKISS